MTTVWQGAVAPAGSLFAYLRWLACRDVVPLVPGAPGDVAAELRAVNARLRELLAERDAELASLRELVAVLQAQVAELAARAGQNSRNSSRPPSSDGLAKPAPKSLRAKSGRKPGRPKGQPGVTMQLSDSPDRVIRHEPAGCSGCAAGLGGAPEKGVIRRQVTEVRAAAIGVYLWHGQFLSRDRACAAMAGLFGCAPSPGALATMTGKIAGAMVPAISAVRDALASAGVAHFDETGFRVAGRLAWVHSASSGKYVLVTVHAKRGKGGMDAAGVLPAFGGIACHDAWAPYDCCQDLAGHALCNAHLLRELNAVAETGTAEDVTWARQATGALLALKKAADEARAAGTGAIGEEALDEHSLWFCEAASAGMVLNAFDLRVPFENNEAERVIRMSKLRIKVSGCMRSMKGAEAFCAIRSYLATAARHGIGWLDAPTRAAQGNPWLP
jgi:transposase